MKIKLSLATLLLTTLLAGNIFADDATYKPFVVVSISEASLEDPTQATLDASAWLPTSRT